MTDNLKNCPFCGSPADDFNPDGDMEGYSIRCSGKMAIFNADETCCPMHTFSYTTMEQAIAAWNRRAESEPSKAEPVELDDDKISEFVDVLRGFSKAYPEDIFTPLTEAERKQMGSLLDRASAGMGRHMGKFMAQAADMIERLATQSTHIENVSKSAGEIDMDKERERFEKWNTEKGAFDSYHRKDDNGEYENPYTKARWEAWQERASLPAQISDEEIIALHDSMFPRILIDSERVMGNVVKFARVLLAAKGGD